MNASLSIRNISSLEKHYAGKNAYRDIPKNITLCRGEVFHWITELALVSNTPYFRTRIGITGPLAENVTAYQLRDIPADLPVRVDNDPDYLFRDPQPVSDLLEPLKNRKFVRINHAGPVYLWFDLEIPEDLEPGTYSVGINVYPVLLDHEPGEWNEDEPFSAPEVTVTVIEEKLPKQELIFTQWFHVDSIARYHRVAVYSEPHWNLIDSYMQCAAKHGMNMILTPVITPPLDTEVGLYRLNTQLTDVIVHGDQYEFGFDKLERYILMALKNGFRYFEIAHLFSQWNMAYAPAVYGIVDGEYKRIFGWEDAAEGDAYKNFLKQFLPALKAKLDELGVLDKAFFHISDEPPLALIDRYQRLHDIVAPLLGDVRMMDALSNLEFYQNGLVQTPVTAINHIKPFLEHPIEHQWAYYCCSQEVDVSNRFLAMPSYRNRIIGLQLYLFDIEGFLQWGYNFYQSFRSNDEINPYITTSADLTFPSGDPFSVYPGPDGALPSLRQKVFFEGLQDLRLCKLAEQKIGKEAVKKLINEEAIAECGSSVTFDVYPRSMEFLEKVNAKLKDIISKERNQ